MLQEALSHPSRGDDWLVTMLVGGALILLGVFVLVGVVLS
jgi:hypothetical protein